VGAVVRGGRVAVAVAMTDEVAALRAVLVRIAEATARSVEEDVTTWSTLRIAQHRGSIIEAVDDVLLDFEDGWAMDEADRIAAAKNEAEP
jgi:hypothetical protein